MITLPYHWREVQWIYLNTPLVELLVKCSRSILGFKSENKQTKWYLLLVIEPWDLYFVAWRSKTHGDYMLKPWRPSILISLACYLVTETIWKSMWTYLNLTNIWEMLDLFSAIKKEKLLKKKINYNQQSIIFLIRKL